MRKFWSVLAVVALASCLSTPCPAAVTADIARSQYTASGSAAFLFDWPIWDDSEILVYADEALVASSLYSLSYTAGDANGGTVTFTTAPTSGTIVTLVRRAEQARTTDFSTSGPFSMSTLNSQIDRLTTQVQDLQEQLNRSLRYKISNTDTFPYTVAEDEWPSPQASRVLGYDGSADPTLYTIDASGSVDTLNSIRQTQTATAGKTAFTTGFTYTPGSSEVAVYVNGVRQSLGAGAYTETDSTTITFSEGLDAGDLVEFVFNEWTGDDATDSQLRTDLITTTSGYGADLVANAAKVFNADDYGSVADALTAAKAAGGGVLYLPSGTHTVASLDLDDNVTLAGDGWNDTILQITTTSDHGIDVLGSDTDALLSLVHIRDLKIIYTGTGQAAGKHGVRITRKVRMDNVWIRDFTNDGIYFDTVNASTQAPYFSVLTNVKSTNNGNYGCNLRDNANANMFIDCQFSTNGAAGFYHQTDGLATYSTVILGGQASYNEGRGWHFDSGTNITLLGAYSEYNSATLVSGASEFVQNTAYTAGDVVTAPSGVSSGQAAVLYEVVANYTSTNVGTVAVDFDTDFNAGDLKPYGEEAYIANGCTFSDFQFGTILGNKWHRIGIENNQTSTSISIGGYPVGYRGGLPLLRTMQFRDGLTLGQNSGSVDQFVQLGAGGAGRLVMREGTASNRDTMALVLNGAPSSPTNQIIIRSLDTTGSGGAAKDLVTAQQNGRLSFHGVTPVAQASNIADPTGGATTDAEARTAINSILDILQGLGLMAAP